MPGRSQAQDRLPFREIDGYRILDRLDEGGMAVVYRARQESPSRTVAIKVIKPDVLSEAALVRFQHEIESLGRFQHPGIAQIHDAGTVEERPYLVMELIEGSSLTDHASAAELDVRERVALVRDVCDAVHHAHQRGVIHRDLKPSNILVDGSGQPKVLDFGIARMTDCDVKVTSMRTEVGELVGTLAYMSPEQASGAEDLDLRTDVYSLGVVLYELLTGTFPYDVHRKMIHEVVQVIREQEPTPLSSHRRVLRGDLETIAIKALEKDPQRRYASASELGADLGRFLDDQPILARPPSTIYQLSKFARRHKAIVGATVIAGVALIVGAGAAVHFAIDAGASSRRAERQAAISSSITEFLNVDLLGALDPRNARGSPLTLREAVDRAAARIGGRFDGEPEVEAGIRQTLGEVYSSLGEVEMAEVQLRRALEVVPADVVEVPYEPAFLKRQLGGALMSLGRLGEAEELLAASVAEVERRHGEGEQLALSLETLGRFLRFENRVEEARERLERATRILTSLRESGDESTQLVDLRVRESLSDLERLDGNRPLARQLLAETLRARVRLQGEDHPDAIATLRNLASIQIDLFELDEGEASCLRLRELAERVYHPRHPVVAAAIYQHGRVLQIRGRFDEATAKITEALELYRQDEGAHPLARLDALFKLGEIAQRRGDRAGAEEWYTRALEVATETYGDRHLSTVSAKSKLGYMKLELGDPEEARFLLEDALEVCNEIAPDGEHVQHVLNNLAFVCRAEGDFEQAEAHMRDVVERVRDEGEDNPGYAAVLENLANMLTSQGEHAEATEILEQVLAIRRETLGERHEAVGRTFLNMAHAWARLGEYARAVECGLSAVEITAENFGPENSFTQSYCGQVAGFVEGALLGDPDVTFALDPGRIEGLVEGGLDHPVLEDIAVRLQ